ncbi:MAG TPA: sugar transferase [Anaerolineae bacterium]|nr:sugar transferase [Anaerolineae bacterium]
MRFPKWPLRISERKALLAIGDIVLVNGAVLFALWVWALRDPLRGFSRGFVLSKAHWFLILSSLWLLAALLNDFYSLRLAADLGLVWPALFKIITFVFLIYIAIYFLSSPQSLPRGVVLYHCAATFGLVALWRGAYAVLLNRPSFRRRAIVIGAGQAGQAIVQAIEENLPSEYQLLGYIDDDPSKQGQVIEGLPVIGTRRDLFPLVKEKDVSEIILAITHTLHGELIRAIMDCQEQGVQIVLMPLLYEEITGRVPVEHVGDDWSVVLPLDHAGIRGFGPFLKRTMDILISGFGLIILALLLPILALAIYLDSPGPIFYTQERVGKGGKVFRILKFRSMIPEAEENGAVWAQENDPRVTRVGRFLRRTMIDELPQFINVLKGEMSIVGPRPERPIFADQLAEEIPFYRARHAVKPGMAGWALINYGYSSSVRDALVKLQYDLYYIKHQSLALDLFILLKTIGAMLLLRGR